MSFTFASQACARFINRIALEQFRVVFQCDPQPAAFVMIASNCSGGIDRSVCGRVAARDPIRRCERGEPQQSCSGGVITSQPLRGEDPRCRDSRPKNQVLRAAEQRDAITFCPRSRSDRRDQFGGKLWLHARRHCFQFAQAFGKQIKIPERRMKVCKPSC